jgi:hypothetical protein
MNQLRDAGKARGLGGDSRRPAGWLVGRAPRGPLKPRLSAAASDEAGQSAGVMNVMMEIN